VKILLKWREVNPDQLDTLGRIPLLYAAQRRHKGVVKILHREREVNSDKQDILGRTPLL